MTPAIIGNGKGNKHHPFNIPLKHLKTIQSLKRHKAHPLLHHLHKKHKISRKTLFYMKEYGPHTHVSHTIIKESFKILIMASIISSLGGIAIENIKETFIKIIPLVVLLPVLNNLIGSFGTIISSRFSTMLHEGHVRGKIYHNKELKRLFSEVFLVAIITTFISWIASMMVSPKDSFGLAVSLKILLIVMADVLILVALLFIVSLIAGHYFYKKKEDPNNFLIPITTSIADFGNMIILTLLILLVF